MFPFRGANTPQCIVGEESRHVSLSYLIRPEMTDMWSLALCQQAQKRFCNKFTALDNTFQDNYCQTVSNVSFYYVYVFFIRAFCDRIYICIRKHIRSMSIGLKICCFLYFEPFAVSLRITLFLTQSPFTSRVEIDLMYFRVNIPLVSKKEAI